MKALARLGPYLKRYRVLIFAGWLFLAANVAADLAIPRLTQTVIDRGIMTHNLNTIIVASLAMVGMTLLSALLTVGNAVLGVRVAQRSGADLRNDLFTHIQSLSFGNLDRMQTGQLLTRLTSDIQQVMQFVSLIVRMLVRAPLMIIGSLGLLFATSWRLALIMLVLMPSSMAITYLFAVKVRPMFMEVQRKLGNLNMILQENLAGVRVVKAFSRAAHEGQRFDRANVDLMQQTLQVGRWLAVLMPALRLITSLGTLAVVWGGGLQAMQGYLTIGQIVAFNNYIMSTMFPLMMLGMMINFVASAAASSERVFEVLDTPPEIVEKPDASARRLGGRVRFENVTFAYNGHEHEPVLSGINIDVESGETVAILGATGAGKSTLVQLIPRFYDVTEGRITIEGVDVRDVTLEALRGQIGVVLQESVLFGATIRDNIRYGRPDASEEQIVAAAKAVQAHDFIMSFPHGYDTFVGERGATLSGGQKQRIAIARALLIDPAILILDDSTSSVDLQTEAKIQRALAEWSPGQTRFVIAQRVSSVMNADRIIVLERGRIAGMGTHAELLETNAIYQDIYRSQLGNSDKGL